MSFKYRKGGLIRNETALTTWGMDKALTVTCMLGHSVAFLGVQLGLDGQPEIAFYEFAANRRAIRSKALTERQNKESVDLEVEKAEAKARRAKNEVGDLTKWEVSPRFYPLKARKLEAQKRDMELKEKQAKEDESQAWRAQENFRRNNNFKNLAILTPDRKALAWACASCFNDGISGANRRTRPQKHTGRLSLWHLVAILANMEQGQSETVKGNEASAKRLGAKYDATSKEGQRKTQKLLDTLSYLETSAQDYAKWERYNHVFSGLSHAQKQQRYSDR